MLRSNGFQRRFISIEDDLFLFLFCCVRLQ